MARFLIDEDLPRSFTRELRAAGFDTTVAGNVVTVTPGRIRIRRARAS